MAEIPDHEKKIAMAMFVCKLIVYFAFTLMNGVQVYYEASGKLIKKNMLNTKFFVFLCMTLFCASRVVFSALFIAYPDNWQVGTIFYFFFSWGIWFVFVSWSFLGSLWLQLLYQFFISKEIRTRSTKKIYIFSFFIVTVYFCWQLPISILFLLDSSLAILEAIGMLTFLGVFFISQIIFGSVLVKRMKESSKTSKYQDSYRQMIYKSKILIYTVVICIIVVLAQDIVINFFEPRDPEPYRDMVISNFLTGICDTSQMIVIMYVLGSSFWDYILFRKTGKLKQNSSEMTNDTKGSTRNSKNTSSKLEKLSNTDNTNSNNETTHEIIITNEKNV
ncbi:hypothetical protein RB653_002891 [Dictyostelium firmibasis]|uniref:THH1/TOM1/TOM3 domain-containing protein n=1 Tax=Dictyostelium firmibasis TaxID=79012 RepID=A0AAN7TYK9_9MYCE